MMWNSFWNSFLLNFTLIHSAVNTTGPQIGLIADLGFTRVYLIKLWALQAIHLITYNRQTAHALWRNGRRITVEYPMYVSSVMNYLKGFVCIFCRCEFAIILINPIEQNSFSSSLIYTNAVNSLNSCTNHLYLLIT